MNKKVVNFFENFIILCILLVLIQTFLSELSIYLGWQGKRVFYIILLGFIFDLIFTIEFIIRVLSAKEKKKYLFYNRGWIDFTSSLPLLLLNSGPSLYLLLFGGSNSIALSVGVLNILKVIKALRVTRILRLVRVMKIFGKIHNTGSKMAQHHISKIATITTMSIILVAIGISVLGINPYGKILDDRETSYYYLLKLVENQDEISRTLFFENDKYLIELYDESILVFKNETNFKNPVQQQKLSKNFIEVKYNDLTAFIYTGDIIGKESLLNIVFFIIIIVQIAFILVFYSSHFVQKITDPIFIMSKGMRYKSYSLQVKIPIWYKDHEVFQLARFYNEKYLPVKTRKIQSGKANISMDDLKNF